MNANQAASVFKTSEDGRKFVAGYFTNVLLRHDFATYINEHLAADFACALADGLHALQKHCNGFAEQAAFQRDARLGALKELAKVEGQRNELRAALEEAIEHLDVLEEAIESLELRAECGETGVNLLPRLKAVIASVGGGESPTNCDGWISVLDRLPEKEGLYAVYLAKTEYGGINKEDGSVGRVDYDEWGDRGDSRGLRWECEYIGWGFTETIDNPRRLEEIVTHWKPMQPPANAPKAPLTDAERDKIIAALKAARSRGEK